MSERKEKKQVTPLIAKRLTGNIYVGLTKRRRKEKKHVPLFGRRDESLDGVGRAKSCTTKTNLSNFGQNGDVKTFPPLLTKKSNLSNPHPNQRLHPIPEAN